MKVIPLGWQERVRIGDVPMGAYFTCILERGETRDSAIIDDATANEFFNKLPRTRRPQGLNNLAYSEIYASAVRGVRAEKAGLPASEISWEDLQHKLRGGN
jgi:hypothetical protein